MGLSLARRAYPSICPGASCFFAKCLKCWQGRQGSNLRQPVLETGALPTELHPYCEPCVAADPRCFKHRRRPDCKGEALPRITPSPRPPSSAPLLAAGAAPRHIHDFLRCPAHFQRRILLPAYFRRPCRVPGSRRNARQEPGIPGLPCTRSLDTEDAPDRMRSRAQSGMRSQRHSRALPIMLATTLAVPQQSHSGTPG